MIETYSHSRLEAFEWCAESYRVKYVLKAFPEVPTSVELFLGDIVHQSLEWLYTVAKERTVLLDELIMHFIETWKTESTKEVRVRNGTLSEYQVQGVSFLAKYYMKHAPFKEETLAIEQEIRFALDAEKQYFVRGFIDRVVRASDGTIEVHDYKTSKYPKTQVQADKDRQLAFYEIGVRELYTDVSSVRLVWHFLAENMQVTSSRTSEQLVQLKQDTIALIKRIEQNTRWSPCGKAWCDWCSWKSKHVSESAQLLAHHTSPPTSFRHPNGNKTVNEFL